jgi:2-keto-4-pentenoate hydratase/2-oxohepta-3-ene-1,7-dioic acid hydratase in catechol pathway
MKIIRYLGADGIIALGKLHPDETVEGLEGDLFGPLVPTGEKVVPAKWLAPLVPAAILGIGLNYRKHAEETKAKIPEYPILFFKNPGALQNPGDPILIPTSLASHEVDYECELAFVISKTCKNVKKADALDYVLGYTAANDVSARDWQKQKGGSQWCRGKSFDTFLPLGPCLVTPDEIPDPNALKLATLLNGQAVQDWTTADMIFDVPTLIEFLSGSTTLLAGSVILTGTPQGVGMARTPPLWLQPGDTVTVEVEKIGRLTNPVALEKF